MRSSAINAPPRTITAGAAARAAAPQQRRPADRAPARRVAMARGAGAGLRAPRAAEARGRLRSARRLGDAGCRSADPDTDLARPANSSSRFGWRETSARRSESAPCSRMPVPGSTVMHRVRTKVKHRAPWGVWPAQCSRRWE